MGRKSTAQPRPALHIPPRGIGPIADPNQNDVLCGRGGRINSHAGNIQFRDIINDRKKEYLAPTTKKLEKAHIAAAIVNDIRGMNPPGRFLKEDRDTGLWFDIGDQKAIKKTGQALREDAPDIRPELEKDSSDDEKKPDGTKSPKNEMEKSPRPNSPKRGNEKATVSPHSPPRAAANVYEIDPQHVPTQGNGWPNWNQNMTPHDYQSQVLMPPPNEMNPYMAQQRAQAQMANQQNTFEPRSIPIQAPPAQNVFSLPQQFMSGARSVGSKVASASKHALEALAHPVGYGQTNADPPEDIAFGRHFHAPPGSVLSSGNTLSTISGLSDPLSSNMSSGMGRRGYDFKPGSGRDSQKRRSRANIRSSLSGSGRFQAADLRANRMSEVTSSFRSTGSMRSLGSLSRSMSFPDMSVVGDGELWDAIMEGDEDMVDAPAPAGNSTLSGYSGRYSASGRNSLMSGRNSLMSGPNSAVSLSLLSGMSPGFGVGDANFSDAMDDGRSFRSLYSEMSDSVNALDLAWP